MRILAWITIAAITPAFWWPAPALGEHARLRCAGRMPYAGRPLHAAVSPVIAQDHAMVDPFPADILARLDDAFVRVRSLTAAPAITAAILRPGGGIWARSVGASSSPVLFWASAGKMATAVVVLQLVEEGKLGLEDPVARWIPDVPNGASITIRDLLAHTSGLYSANEDPAARAKPRFLDVDAQLAIVRRHGALFCPGSNWRYSNTGYSLLGEIVRRVDGRPIHAAIEQRIITPLGLRSMRALAPGGSSAGVAPLSSKSTVMMQPAWAGAAGPIVSDASDMTYFLWAMLNGKLIKRETAQTMAEALYPMFDAGTFYGLGLMFFEVPEGDRLLQWIGHAGGTPGASAVVAYSRADSAIVAVALTGDGSAIAAANYLLAAL